ncbi:hypothetical protein [Paraburkholderia adhaesiva]|uniref:hypothetical protein n=1 Tax=Paraburkholderia adhaesiva TaxID=2883244 RepID=UPI001F4010BF|nr:hypothetical protein [Paraburkholderia adhaesiva]
MPFFQTLLKLFTSVWSVVREMVLNNESFLEVLRQNRRRAIFSIVVMASLAFSAISLGVDARFVSILIRYVRLERKYQDLETASRREHEMGHPQAGHQPSAPDARTGTTSDPVTDLRSALTDWEPEN